MSSGDGARRSPFLDFQFCAGSQFSFSFAADNGSPRRSGNLSLACKNQLSSRAVANVSISPKKPSVGRKKPLQTPGSSPPLSRIILFIFPVDLRKHHRHVISHIINAIFNRKKQKVSDSFLDESIEGLNDVTAVTGIDLREEEEQLFSGSTGNSQVSEASNRVVQEEERLVLQRTPLQKKLAAITAKCGLKGISNDVEQCLSLCVEERLRGLVCNLIRLSKQRVDAEKARHQTLITSDVQQQIATIHKNAREEKERKQAEVEKLPKFDEVTMKDENEMKISAANAAVRAAVGGDDMLSKWRLMAEQASQKHEGVMVMTSGSQADKDMNYKPLLTPERDNQEAQESPLSNLGTARTSGRNQVASPQTGCARTISIKDVIAVLERDPNMSKSMLLYRLYNRIQSEGTAE
ncbi:hypothetical protein SLEP1_g2111 [Rubroshorea leprosula]|uniref:Transcription initiation factor TFIID component TAF4 C-terminal domain-containing protein n=1 Tax=Rubroshorea leprosula TaxID=152421 RepID=A0AAV5HPU2_9ROSI|nr:hypothetical protein SLEP1_g2111 [Rubroshorea leprosula]